MTSSDLPRIRVEWKVTLGALCNAVLLTCGFIWTISAFAAKTQADGIADKDLATALKSRIEVIDTRTLAQDNRLTAVETGIGYIRETLARIEQNTKRP